MTSGAPQGEETNPRPTTRDDPLVEVIASVEKGIREAVEELSEGLEGSVSVPLRDAFASAAEAHSRLIEEASSHPGAETIDSGPGELGAVSAEPAGSLSSYRRGVLTEVLEPLRDFLLSTTAASRLEAEWASFTAKLLRLGAALPSQVHRPEPPDLYRPKKSDRLPRAAGKGFARVRRQGALLTWKALRPLRRLFGEVEEGPPLRILAVPVRSVAMRFFEGPLTLALEPLREDLHQHFARPLASLERGLAEWIRTWPPTAWESERETGRLTPMVRKQVTDLLLRVPEGEPGHGVPELAGSLVDPETGALFPWQEGGVSKLSSGLDHEKAIDPPLTVLEKLDSALQDGLAVLRAHLDASGSFMRSSPPPRSLRRARRESVRGDRRAESWVRWQRSIPNRFLLAIHLQRFQNEVVEAQTRLANGVAEGVLIPLGKAWSSCSEGMQDLKTKADLAFADARSSSGATSLPTRLAEIRDEGVKVLEETWLRPLAPDGIEPSLHELADAASTRLARHLQELPDTLSVQETQARDGSVDPERGFREIRLRGIAHQVLDVLRLEKLRNAPAPLYEVLASARAEAGKLPEMLRFNLDAAMEEVGRPSNGTPEDAHADAASLSVEGIKRTQDAIGPELRDLPGSWDRFLSEAEGLLADAFLEIHGKATMVGGVQEQIVGITDRMAHRLRSETVRAERLGAQGLSAGRRLFRRATLRLLRAVRAGRSVVGVTPVAQGEGERALAVIRQAPELLSGLPLVYRRLFSFEPITEEGLLKGRTQETAWVESRFEHWERGIFAPLLLTGPVGAGHTSFFNVLSSTVFSGAQLHRLELKERIASEALLATQIAEAFGLPSADHWDLPRLAAAVRSLPSRGRPRVILIERLEHIFLRVPGGTDLFEDFLSLQVQTSDRVFWLSSMSGAAWKLVAKTEPRSASLVQVHPLAPPSRAALEELILERHHRSGLPLEFHPAPDLNPLVRRRLRLSPSEKARQRILQTEYFDRLFRLSQESIPMAILHWLRSTDFRLSDGRLAVTPPPEIRYGFLDELDLDLYFALKAFLEHGSLTLKEYREVFAASEDESFQTFKVLGSKLLLESTAKHDVTPTALGGELEEGERYRVPALLSQVVALRLKNRNILH